MIIGRSSITGNPYVDRARSLLATNPKYSQQYRYSNGRFYDCSSFVQAAYGIPDNITTAIMPKILPKHGFTYYKGLEGLQPGDILWRNGHTEVYTGDGFTLGAHSTKNGVSEYKYRDNLRQYAGYFRPPQSPMTTPTQTPYPASSGSNPVSMPTPTQDALQHEPATNTVAPGSMPTYMGNGYAPAQMFNTSNDEAMSLAWNMLGQYVPYLNPLISSNMIG